MDATAILIFPSDRQCDGEYGDQGGWPVPQPVGTPPTGTPRGPDDKGCNSQTIEHGDGT